MHNLSRTNPIDTFKGTPANQQHQTIWLFKRSCFYLDIQSTECFPIWKHDFYGVALLEILFPVFRL